KNLEMKFSFSTIFLRSKTLHITGTYVILKISEPKRAYPKVKANGENIFPSTFWKEKIGIKATIRMICAKTIYPATLPALFLISPDLDILLKTGIPTLWAFFSIAT